MNCFQKPLSWALTSFLGAYHLLTSGALAYASNNSSYDDYYKPTDILNSSLHSDALTGAILDTLNPDDDYSHPPLLARRPPHGSPPPPPPPPPPGRPPHRSPR